MSAPICHTCGITMPENYSRLKCSDCRNGYESFTPKKMFARIRKGARVRGIDFNLSFEEFAEVYQSCNDACQITGLPFCYERWPGSTKRPYIPSVDRISSCHGYEVGNIRIILSVINIAMNEWGIEPLLDIADRLKPDRWAPTQFPVTAPSGYLTAKEFIHLKGLSLAPNQTSRLSLAASKLCADNAIPVIRIASESGRDTVPTYPEKILALAANSLPQNRLKSGAWPRQLLSMGSVPL